MENDIDYAGSDDTMPDGKLKCSSANQSLCAQRTPVHDVPSCKSFCHLSKYFTWKASIKECYCKNSDLGKRQEGGSVSGRTKCQGKLGLTKLRFYLRRSQQVNKTSFSGSKFSGKSNFPGSQNFVICKLFRESNSPRMSTSLRH